MDADSFDMANFFQIHKTKFPHVFAAARLVLLTPATSGPVERVFSQGSILKKVQVQYKVQYSAVQSTKKVRDTAVPVQLSTKY